MAAIDPHSYSDLSQGKIKHIEFQIGVDFQGRALQVRAKYRMDRPVSGSLFLDSRGVEIKQISSGTKRIEYEMDVQDPILGARLCLKDLDAVGELAIELTTSPEARALQWLEPRQTTGGRHPFLYSQCYSLHARSIFPCQDTPSVRFTYEAHLRVPRNLAAVMAAAPLGAREEGETKTYSFRMPQPVPSYLFAFAVGDLRFKELGARTGIYAEPEMLEAAAWEFAENERKMDEAERLLGPYLWDRYDLLILPPSFPYGGMENPRLTFITPLAVLGDRSRTSLISHELAHAWTGNLVTNATWEDFWLNEGWTTYAESRITEVVEGEEQTRLQDAYAQMHMKEEMQIFGEGSDLTCLKVPMKGINPDEVVSSIPYTKGQLFLSSLERAVGRERFDGFIHKYIARYSFQSLSTEGFVEFLKEELPEAPEKVDIQEWLYRPGLPAGIPPASSRLYEDVKARLAAYERGILPTGEDVQGWRFLQKTIFFDSLPERIPPKDCQYFEELFGLGESLPTLFLMKFYRVCIRSDYREALPGIERLVLREGRVAILKPLFRCMLENEWTRDLARPMFESARERYHPITATVLDALLIQAGV